MPRHQVNRWQAYPVVPPRPHRRRRLARVLVAAALAIGVPLSASVTLPAPTLQPIGGVRGAVATPVPSASLNPTTTDGVSPAGAPRRFAYAGTDREMPLTRGPWLPRDPSRLTGYQWPLAKGAITLPFKAIPGGTRINEAGRLFHDGIDLASFCGDRVHAAHDGVVLAAGRHFDDVVGWIGSLRAYYAVLDARHMWIDLPLTVVIDDGNGYRSIYAHFARVDVKVGQLVHAGQVIGLEGMSGHASGCHVHFGLFSPLETRTFGVRADILRRLKLPKYEIARIDPLLVLPDGAKALRVFKIPAQVVPTGDGSTTSPDQPGSGALPAVATGDQGVGRQPR